MKDVQLTATLPLSFTHDRIDDWRGGTGDVELGVKYRFFNDEKAGVSAAIFPRIILPTSSNASGGTTLVLLPLWLELSSPGKGPTPQAEPSRPAPASARSSSSAARSRLLVSGGPTWADRQTSYHAYTALSLNF